jgi:HAE1 family hydrophobic/amphiphilic exporter-1
LLIAATVPLSLCVTLGVMFFSDMSLNILSLVGLMLAIGLLVDNSVVSSEAIDYRRIQTPNGYEAASLGIRDVGLAITAGTLTTVIVFVPSFMTDIQQVAIIQQNLAIPLVVSLLASLLIAQTLVPTVVERLPVKNTRQSKLAASGRSIVACDTLGLAL